MFIKIDSNHPTSLPKLQGAICFCEWDGKILMLKRSPNSPQGGFWTGAPGGKLEAGETALTAAVREVREETGIQLQPENLEFRGSFLCSYPDIEYLLHIFYTKLQAMPLLAIDPIEHTEYLWATVEEALRMPLMRGGIECLQAVFAFDGR